MTKWRIELAQKIVTNHEIELPDEVTEDEVKEYVENHGIELADYRVGEGQCIEDLWLGVTKVEDHDMQMYLVYISDYKGWSDSDCKSFFTHQPDYSDSYGGVVISGYKKAKQLTAKINDDCSAFWCLPEAETPTYSFKKIVGLM
jgi:hypothetical protein